MEPTVPRRVPAVANAVPIVMALAAVALTIALVGQAIARYALLSDESRESESALSRWLVGAGTLAPFDLTVTFLVVLAAMIVLVAGLYADADSPAAVLVFSGAGALVALGAFARAIAQAGVLVSTDSAVFAGGSAIPVQGGPAVSVRLGSWLDTAASGLMAAVALTAVVGVVVGRPGSTVGPPDGAVPPAI